MESKVNNKVPVEGKENKESATNNFSNQRNILNTETMASINEALGDIRESHLKGASSYEELENLLNK